MIYSIFDIMSTMIRNAISTQVFEVLRHRIVSLQIVPGAKLNISALSKELSVSAIPIREALKQLIERGLVYSTPDIGYHAVNLSEQDVRDIFELRQLLETFAVEKAIECISQIELKTLYEETCELLEGEIPQEQLRTKFDQADIKLHKELIIGNSGNKYVKLLYMYDFISIVRHLNERMLTAAQEHLGIIDALREKNVTKTQHRLCKHLDNSLKECLPIPQSGFEWPSRSNLGFRGRG